MNVVLPFLAPALRPERRTDPGAAPVETAFTALRIEGGLFPAEFLQRVAALTASGQAAEDYGLPPGRTLRDEIGRFWTIAEALWKEYRQNRPRQDLPAERTGVERWLVRLLRDVFGHADVTACPARAALGDRSFPITHRVHGGAVPLLLTVADRDLDRSHPAFGEEGRRRAPHATVQEFLNADPATLWGIVANGPRLRLLRDNPSLTRPAYVEADLERIFEEGLYSDFATLWLLAHASRSAPGPDGTAGCWLERWRAEGAKTGQRALEKLRAGVTTALRELGSGFVEHPENDALRVALRDGTLTAEHLHQQLLRLVYRLLFLFTAEERGVLHTPDATPEARALYAQGYALTRLRERARLKRHYDGYADLWAGLLVTVGSLSRGTWLLGLPGLGGLFDEGQCPDLDAAGLPNARLLAAVHALAFFTDAGSLQRVNYRDMGTEELGSVYESLLDLHPLVQVETRPWTFGFVGDDAGGAAKGSERKLSGSYYTPDSLVQELLRSALDPVIQRAKRDNPADPRGALLRLKVLDPACGSGHFLLGAARRLADAVARLDSEGDLPDEMLRRRALREVVRRCIYGVDRNPLSVELCKAALWIETVEPGKPLTFLDAHIKCGDSLIGVADLAVLTSGIPDEAFKDLTGDDKAYARDLRRRNKAERDDTGLPLLPDVALPPGLVAAIAALTDAPEDTMEAVAAKRRALADVQSGGAGHDLRVACDLWCAAFFAPRPTQPEMRGRDMVPTTGTVRQYLRAPSSVYGPLIAAVEELRGRLRFFHWPLEFPDVMAAGGFDCLLGNPPWEVAQVDEKEYFSARIAGIRNLDGQDRKALIDDMRNLHPILFHQFGQHSRDLESFQHFAKNSGRYKLCNDGKSNLYSLFSEASIRLLHASGILGMVLQSGILTDKTNTRFVDFVFSDNRLISFVDMVNLEGIFPGVHRTHPHFALTTISGGPRTQAPIASFYNANIGHISDCQRIFSVNSSELSKFNPQTRTIPAFRSRADKEITQRIYGNTVLLGDENQKSPYKLKIIQNFFSHTTDGKMFVTRDKIVKDHIQSGNVFLSKNGDVSWRPLYEGKMVDQYDHRCGSFEARVGERGNRNLPPTSREDYRNPKYVVVPHFWVAEKCFRSRVVQRGLDGQFVLVWKDITTAVTERTVKFCVLPLGPTDDSLSFIHLCEESRKYSGFLLANMNSLVLDYVARQKVSGLHLRKGTLSQLPVIDPRQVEPTAIRFVSTRAIALSLVADDLTAFAREQKFEGGLQIWDDERRALLQADIDAVFACLYGLTRDELRYILDPSDVYGTGFPSETFRVLKEREKKQFGEYRTARLVLAAWDRLMADGTFKE